MRSFATKPFILTWMLLALTVPGFAASQDGSKERPTPEEIIRQFTEKEAEFYEAWMGYTYTQTAVIRVLAVDNVPVNNEALMLVFEVVFNDDGTREVRLVDRRGRLRSIRYTPEDEEVITNLNPFALTSKDLSLYNLDYRGEERVDELDCYVFEVKPKSTKGERLYFDGKIWVDTVDLQVVRTVGRVVPERRDNQFPEFETLRQVIDGKYWFPVWTHADEVLRFPNQQVHVEQTITYEGYKEFGSKTRIRFGGQVAPDDPE
ncbi:MAG: hypothetical protein JW793_10950 [Acidobacteria bacterium]|nr:hypothetical protein [Acidobacteriota bacterium]